MESISRQASLVYFVEKNFKAIKIISYNINSLNISQKKYKIVKSDVIRFLKRFNEFKWDIIFLDPPYNISSSKMKDVFGLLDTGGTIGDGTLMVYEYFFKKDIKSEIGNLEILKESFFGDKKVVYLTPRKRG